MNSEKPRRSLVHTYAHICTNLVALRSIYITNYFGSYNDTFLCCTTPIRIDPTYRVSGGVKRHRNTKIKSFKTRGNPRGRGQGGEPHQAHHPQPHGLRQDWVEDPRNHESWLFRWACRIESVSMHRPTELCASVSRVAQTATQCLRSLL
jgi:hypothetical protein